MTARCHRLRIIGPALLPSIPKEAPQVALEEVDGGGRFPLRLDSEDKTLHEGGQRQWDFAFPHLSFGGRPAGIW